MSRAVVAGVVGVTFALAGCSGGGSASPLAAAPACRLLVQLAQTGQTVATADVSDPAAFDATLREAVAKFVRTAKELSAAVPAHVRVDVERMIAAAEQHRFADARSARANVDTYAHSACKTSNAAT